MPRRPQYGGAYERARRALLATPRVCALRLVCDGAHATTADHDPPISRHTRPHVDGSGCCRLQPACQPCQSRQGGMLATGQTPPPPLPIPSRRW